MTIRSSLQIGLAFAAIGTLLVLWGPLGNIAAYVALIFAILSALLHLNGPELRAILFERWVQMHLAAFVLIALAFALSAEAPQDISYIADFLVLVLVVPIALAFGGIRRYFNAHVFAALALTGAVAALLTGINEVVIMGAHRAHGLENSPIHFGNIAAIAGFLALGGTLYGSSRWRAIYCLGPIVGLSAAALSGTRSTLLVVAALGVLFAVFFLVRRSGTLGAKLGYAGICGLVIAGLIVAAQYFGLVRIFDATEILGQILSGQEIADSSSVYRLEMYRAGVLAFLDSPIFGHGWRDQVTSALPHMSEYGRQGYERAGWDYIHNEPLGFAISGGVIGFAGYVLLMTAPIVGAMTRKPDTQSEARLYLCLCLVLGLLAAGMTDVLFMSELPKTFLVMASCAVLVGCVDRTSVVGTVGSRND